MRTASVLLTLFCLVAAGCVERQSGEDPPAGGEATQNQATQGEATQSDGPVGATWRLAAFGAAADGGARPAADRPASTADFERTSATGMDGRVSGSGGCSRYSVGYQAGRGTLTVAPVEAGAERACRPPAMQQQRAYFAALGAARRWEQSGNQLLLMDESGQLLLRFVAETEMRSDAASGEAGGPEPG